MEHPDLPFPAFPVPRYSSLQDFRLAKVPECSGLIPVKISTLQSLCSAEQSAG